MSSVENFALRAVRSIRSSLKYFLFTSYFEMKQYTIYREIRKLRLSLTADGRCAHAIAGSR